MSSATMFAGDDLTIEISVVDQAGDAVDLTGAASVRWEASRSVNSRPAVLAKSLGSGITVTDAEGGVFEVALVSADTENLRGDFYIEAEVIDAQGATYTVETGTLTITPTLIKPEA